MIMLKVGWVRHPLGPPNKDLLPTPLYMKSNYLYLQADMLDDMSGNKNLYSSLTLSPTS